MVASENIRKQDNKRLGINQGRNNICDQVALVWKHRERILSDERLYAMEVPGCACGDCYLGMIPFTAGIMLECWERCPEFTLRDGFKVCLWGGSVLSGTCIGYAFNPETGEIRRFECEVRQRDMIAGARNCRRVREKEKEEKEEGQETEKTEKTEKTETETEKGKEKKGQEEVKTKETENPEPYKFEDFIKMCEKW